MSLRISNLKKNGDADNEYILLEATADVNISNYAIVDKTFDKDGSVSNIHKHYYRFPSKDVKKGEYISLHTGLGNDRIDKLKSGEKLHMFFWGSKTSFWNDDKIEKAELLKVSTIDTKLA